ncbi:hypothetical protein CR205_03250 [Alteribacter lacisalsi]|uniref:Uncharacterized protein n=1 Tax=Alteribacter lacisalsi TaxID=2045244 RepID=A0A2W0HA20_9BACI|nr:hypothetical protein CR205_03250 [Alteribacter lacisalsi]
MEPQKMIASCRWLYNWKILFSDFVPGYISKGSLRIGKGGRLMDWNILIMTFLIAYAVTVTLMLLRKKK